MLLMLTSVGKSIVIYPPAGISPEVVIAKVYLDVDPVTMGLSGVTEILPNDLGVAVTVTPAVTVSIAYDNEESL